MNTPMTARITSTSETTNPKFTAHFSLRCDETPKTWLDGSYPATCEILSQAQRRRQRYVIRGLTSILPNSQSACGLACGAGVEDCDAGLDYECCLLPRRSDSSHCAMPKRTLDSGIFEGFSWSV